MRIGTSIESKACVLFEFYPVIEDSCVAFVVCERTLLERDESFHARI
jgi:hypothetical protein